MFLVIISLCLLIHGISTELNSLVDITNNCYSNIPFQNVYTILLYSSTVLSDYKVFYDYNFSVYLLKNSSAHYFKRIQKPFLLLFSIESVTEFENILNKFYKTNTWNSRAYYVIYIKDKSDVAAILKVAWKYILLNVNVVDTTSEEVYRYYPYKNNECGEIAQHELVGTCSKGDQFDFPEKIPTNLHGCPVRIMAYNIKPYVIDINAPREDPSQSGLEVTIVHVLSQRMNFTEQYKYNPYINWGQKLPNGSYTYMYKELYDQRIDVIFGLTNANASYLIDFDPLYCYLNEYAAWFVPSALPKAQWKNLTEIFQLNLWCAIIFVLITNGFVIWAISKFTEPTVRDLSEYMMSSLYIMLQGSVHCPKTWRLRGLLALWLFTCLLIYAAHQSQLISILTSPIYDHQISTLEELLQSDLKYGFYFAIEEAYNQNLGPYDKIIMDNYISCPLSEECVNRSAFHRDFAVIKGRRQVNYLMPRYYTFPNGKPMLYDMDEIAFSSRPRQNSRRGFPFFERWDKLLMLMQSNGLINKWDKDAGYMVLRLEAEPDHKPLSIGHLQGAFFGLAFGMLFGLGVFICEICYAKIISTFSKE